MNSAKVIKIGIIGTGYIARGLNHVIGSKSNLQVVKILTRRKIDDILGFNKTVLTNSLEEVIDAADVIVELSGTVKYADRNINRIIDSQIPVVTRNSEFQVSAGSKYAHTGLLTEAAGDQPGCLAEMHEELVQLGFEPLVYGNLKGFLCHDPTPKDMAFWAKKQGISLKQVIGSTDGTKLQIEQALVANGLGAGIVQTGLTGHLASSLEDGAAHLTKLAIQKNYPISDYLLNAKDNTKSLNGVFVVARHQAFHQPYLEYYKLGSGPNYIFHRPYYLPHLEIIRTIEAIVQSKKILLTNSASPRIGVAAIAKRDLQKGYKIEYAIGSYDFRGVAIEFKEHPNCIQIGLLEDVVLQENIEKGQMVEYGMVADYF